MSKQVETEYISVGGNRHTAASAWSSSTGTLAYGADQNIAIWRPLDPHRNGVSDLLRGLTEKVSALSFQKNGVHEKIIGGSAAGELAIWVRNVNSKSWQLVSVTQGHAGAVNSITVLENARFVATGSADASIKIWAVDQSEPTLLATIKTSPRFIPLALQLGHFASQNAESALFLAAAGTRFDIQIYAIRNLATSPVVEHQAALTGHEGWIRSLALKRTDTGYLLASTSHDKYVRLWRFQVGETQSTKRPEMNGLSQAEPALTAKVKTVSIGDMKYSITFEALLLGHEDWIYSADWQPSPGERLLTASADGTLAIWEPDPTSGIWVSESRLGEISGQKGATTATGSAGGFWTGKWIELDDNDGHRTAVVSLGRTGSWRVWELNPSSRYWEQTTGVSGHVSSINGLSWSPDGAYLLSASSDQTTRLHAEWRRSGTRTWHEFARPQIHGYDLNCLSHCSPHQFVSGADEKLLRVFNEPREIADMLQRLCGIQVLKDVSLPETAAIPVLGLSNKAMGEPDDIVEAGPRRMDDDYAAASRLADVAITDIKEPPTEDLLARHTLWPEHEKLYGHGYEISECAYGHGILATACKASSLEHATIRLYDASNDWREIKPPLTAHSLTVTRLAWSRHPDTYLLSVGRDRQWTVFEKPGDGSTALKAIQTNAKAHTRMILDAAWSPVAGQAFFATAGRDKVVKLWARCSAGEEGTMPFELKQSLTRGAAVTAISFTCDRTEKYVILAAGEESGSVSVHVYCVEQDLALKRSVDLDENVCPSKAVNRLAWRPDALRYKDGGVGQQLAVAAADGSVRILRINIEKLCEDV